MVSSQGVTVIWGKHNVTEAFFFFFQISLLQLEQKSVKTKINSFIFLLNRHLASLKHAYIILTP